ncbi:MAG: hypothetical protein WAT43_08950 [Chitinophagales bacterium]|nr:hypothetical protein [Bacteroidota bacterium]
MKPYSTESLLERIQILDQKIIALKEEFREKDNWFDKFELKLDELATIIKSEAIERKSGDTAIHDSI